MPPRELQDAYRRVYAQFPPPPPSVGRPILIVISGLPGTGKSTVAVKLATQLPALVVESDFVRKILVSQPAHSTEENALVHTVSRALMWHWLKTGHHVIADSTNLREQHRQWLLSLAEAVHVPALVVQTTAPAAVVQKRLREREIHRGPHDLSDANWAIYEHLARGAEPIETTYLQVDTTCDLDREISQILRAARHAIRAYPYP